MAAKKLEVVPAAEFVQLVSDRLAETDNGASQKLVREVIKAMEAEVADCVAQGYGVRVGQLVKIEPRYRAGLPRAKRFSPFDGETKMRPAKPESVNVKAQALIGAKRDIPGPKTKAFKDLVSALPKPKPQAKAKAKAGK